MLDQKEEFLRTVVDRGDGTIVTIGDENMDEQMSDYTMITATYSVDGRTVGKIGVIGPKRMKYGEVTSVMEYLTENLNNSFKLEDEQLKLEDGTAGHAKLQLEGGGTGFDE